jgi:sortase A
MKNKKSKVFVLIGLLLLGAALCLTIYNLQENKKALNHTTAVIPQLIGRINYEKEQQTEEMEVPDYIKYPDKEMPVQVVDGIEYIGVLEIPVLNLSLPVISQWDYPSLRMAPCRYEGSAYLNNLVIAGHNYDSHFGRLDKLFPGREIFFTDCDGNRFAYEMVGLEILKNTQVEEMISGDWDLTLFTCTYGGQSREAIRCVRKEP